MRKIYFFSILSFCVLALTTITSCEKDEDPSDIPEIPELTVYSPANGQQFFQGGQIKIRFKAKGKDLTDVIVVIGNFYSFYDENMTVVSTYEFDENHNISYSQPAGLYLCSIKVFNAEGYDEESFNIEVLEHP